LRKEYDISIDWRGFELHPEIPVGGADSSAFFPPQHLKRMHEQLKSFAQSFGVDITFVSHWPNTRRALAMAEFAREKGVLDLFRETAMLAYWRKGEDLENEIVLKRIASETGLDPDAAMAASIQKHYQTIIDAVRSESEAVGVRGIPMMIIGSERIEGCQPYEEIAAACERAGVERRATRTDG
jgi:predicted DsbA family dithiol-disulfide isomerase